MGNVICGRKNKQTATQMANRKIDSQQLSNQLIIKSFVNDISSGFSLEEKKTNILLVPFCQFGTRILLRVTQNKMKNVKMIREKICDFPPNLKLSQQMIKGKKDNKSINFGQSNQLAVGLGMLGPSSFWSERTRNGLKNA